MATRTPSTRSRSTSSKTPRRRASSATKSTPRAATLTDEAKTAVRSVRTRATRAAKRIPTDRTTIGIAAGWSAGIVAAGVAMFINRDKLRVVASDGSEKLKAAASSGSEKLRKVADDLSTMAHDRIDQARDNITRFRTRQDGTPAEQPAADPFAANG